jgi:hypothetical protein
VVVSEEEAASLLRDGACAQLDDVNELSGNVDPNTAGVRGQRGWTYQDTNTGTLYVYGETVGSDAWLPVLTDQNSAPGSSDGQIFTSSGGYPQWAYSIENDDGVIMQWAVNTGVSMRASYDGYESANFENRTLNAGEQLVYDWSSNIVYDWNGSGEPSVNFGSRQMFASNGVACINYGNEAVQLAAPAGGNGPTLYNASLTNTSAPICGFNTQTFTPTTGQTVTVATTSGNNILIAVTGSGTLATLTIALANMLNNQPSTEAIIYIHSSRTITSLTLTYSGYTFTGTAITTLAANATHVLRRSGGDLYHVQ